MTVAAQARGKNCWLADYPATNKKAVWLKSTLPPTPQWCALAFETPYQGLYLEDSPRTHP